MTDSADPQSLFHDRKARQRLEEFLDVDPLELAREEELGAGMSLAAIVPRVEALQQIFRYLSSRGRHRVTNRNLANLGIHLDSAWSIVKEARNLRADVPNASSRRQNLLQSADLTFDEVSSLVAPFAVADALARRQEIEASVIRKATTRVQEETFKLKQSLAEVSAAVDSIEDSGKRQIASQVSAIEALRVELEETLSAAREASGARGVEAHEKAFGAAAKSYQTRSRWWLVASAVFTVVTALVVGAAGYYHLLHPPTSDASWNVQLAVSQLSMLSLLFFLVVFSGRNYRTNRHLQSVYEHRTNALGTFSAFVKAAGDDDIKNAVLLQTTQAIFTHQATGFLHRDQEVPTNPLAVLEIVRGGRGNPER